MMAMMMGGGPFGGGGMGVGSSSSSSSSRGSRRDGEEGGGGGGDDDGGEGCSGEGCSGEGGSGGGLTPSPPHHSHNLRLPSPHSPPSPASSESPTSPPSPGRGGNKACGVCGDIAKSMHFGGLSCDSCKAFFRRSVQNNAHKGFTCPYDKKCVIAISSRKSCQYCRFHKCLSIGMEKGWVMTENERRKMMQQRQDRKVKEDQHKRSPSTSESEKWSLSQEDHTEISIIVQLYKKAYQDVPYEENMPTEGATGVMSPWMTFCKRIGYFFSLFREFAELSSNDQALLLKTAITSACIIMGSVVYDANTGSWPGKGISRSGFIPNVTTQNVERFVPAELMNRVEHFFRKFQQVCPDETMAMILILVALYSPELMGLEAKDTIQGLQDRYTRILHKYVCYKYKEQAALMFPKVIVSLADIRELAERTSQMRIQKGVASSIPSLSSFLPSKPRPQPLETPMETNEDEAAGERVQIKQESDLEQDNALTTPAAAKRMRMEATGGVRDHTYQGIMQKINEMHNSVHLRAPSLLPFIIQIVKKVGAGNSASTASSAVATSLSETRGGRQHFGRQQRGGPKRRPQVEQVFVKQETFNEDLDSQDMAIASPASTTTATTTTTVSPPSLQTPSPHFPHHHHLPTNLPTQTQQPPHNLRNAHHQHQQHHHHTQQQQQQQQQQQHHQQQLQPQLQPQQLQPQQYNSSHPNLSSPYPASPMESDLCEPLSPIDGPGCRLSPSNTPSPLLTADLSMLPQTSQMVPVAPYTPPAPAPSPSVVIRQSHLVPVADLPLPSPVAAPSPYSDTSTSSPESSQSPFSELFSEELSDVEIDVLTQLLDYVSNFENLENVSSLKEVLPPHLLMELQTKLCSYSFKPE